ncbi:MAG TPA: response regulator transcription factor [Steroidobacteraceae bacterium]|nr:response regulator transcription factor [Steroidobacteraceae bacterium]
MRVLLAEDDRMIAEAVRTALGQDGHVTDWMADGAAALAALSASRFDIVLLDLGLPRMDGLTVLRHMRERGDVTPVIIITARDDVRSRVAGLDTGADDYLVKPFDLDELAARMRAAQRRSAGRGDPVIEHGDVRVNCATREVHKGPTPVPLSAKEYAVLEALLLRPGVVLSRTQLEDRLYGFGESVESNAVEVYVHSLRRKLGTAFIQTRRGAGYFVPR